VYSSSSSWFFHSYVFAALLQPFDNWKNCPRYLRRFIIDEIEIKNAKVLRSNIKKRLKQQQQLQ